MFTSARLVLLVVLSMTALLMTAPVDAQSTGQPTAAELAR